MGDGRDRGVKRCCWIPPTALVRGPDVNQAQAVVAMDDRLDDLQRQIRGSGAILPPSRETSGPMAVDLREVIATIRIASDIERNGDMAKNIGKRTLAGLRPVRAAKEGGARCQPDEPILSAGAAQGCPPMPISQGNLEGGDGCLGARRKRRRCRSIPRCFANCFTYMMEGPRKTSPSARICSSAPRMWENVSGGEDHIHQYRGDGALPRQGRTADGRAPEEGSHLPRACRSNTGK